jgi:hypothetical protein
MSCFHNKTVIEIQISKNYKYVKQSVRESKIYSFSPPRISQKCSFLVKPHTKKVRFDDHVVIHEYDTYIPCMQETLDSWRECKKQHLQDSYLANHGTLDGFDFNRECIISDNEDEKLDHLLRREEGYPDEDKDEDEDEDVDVNEDEDVDDEDANEDEDDDEEYKDEDDDDCLIIFWSQK